MKAGWLQRPRTDERILSELSISELPEKDCICVPPDMLLRDFIEIVSASGRNDFPVIDLRSDHYIGMIRMDEIRPVLFDTGVYNVVTMEQMMDDSGEVAYLSKNLNAVLERMHRQQRFSIPVLSGKRFMGMISKATLLERYRRELKVQTQ